MQALLKRESDPSTAYSTPPCNVNHPSWWTSTESQVEQSPKSNSLSLKMAGPIPHCRSVKQLGFQFQDQDSSSTQSTCQSYPEVASIGESYLFGQKMIPIQSGYNGTHYKPEGHIESALSVGTQDHALTPQADCEQPYACIPLLYPDPHSSGLLAPYIHQAMIHHSQMMGMTSSRVPLPHLDLTQDEPIYVNAKQYNAILRRRQNRAKLEAQDKLSKPRKPYLHESRHAHAVKRVRGPGGRFLDTKKPQETKSSGSANGQDKRGLVRCREVCGQENHKDAVASTTSCSDITSASNSDTIFQQQEPRFSFYQSRVAGPTQDSGGSMHRYFSVFR